MYFIFLAIYIFLSFFKRFNHRTGSTAYYLVFDCFHNQLKLFNHAHIHQRKQMLNIIFLEILLLMTDDDSGWVPVGLCGNAGSDGFHADGLPRVLLQCAHGGGGGGGWGEGGEGDGGERSN